MKLPPGQQARADFPRFGLPRYAERFPSRPDDRRLELRVLSNGAVHLEDALAGLTRVVQHSDFHCVTTWSHTGLAWSGVRFSEFFDKRVRSEVPTGASIEGVVLHAQDGFRTTLALEDLLENDVLLADGLNGQPLTIEHGAPLRLVTPAHYGYKNLKHLQRMEFHATLPEIKHGLYRMLDHPRARVAQEERGRYLPGWMLRCLYRPLIGGTVRQFRRERERHGEQEFATDRLTDTLADNRGDTATRSEPAGVHERAKT